MLKFNRWKRRLLTGPLLALCSATSLLAETDFNQVGQQFSLLLQQMHFSDQRLDKAISSNFLNTYLDRVDPFKIYFTQADIDVLKNKYDRRLANQLLAANAMPSASVLYDLYCERAARRINYALSLLDDDSERFDFSGSGSVLLTRRKAQWPRHEEEMEAVWHDWIKKQLLDVMLQSGGTDDFADSKSVAVALDDARRKLRLRYQRQLRKLKDSADDENKINIMLAAVAGSMDPHSDYLGATVGGRFQDELGGSLTGIGVTLGEDDDGVFKISGLYIGGPADQSGEVRLNDRIIAIDTDCSGNMIDVTGSKLLKVTELIRGGEGTLMRLKLESPDKLGNHRLVTLKRRVLDNKESLARGEIIEFAGSEGATCRIGVLELPSFYGDVKGGARRCSTDVKALLEKMSSENVDGLVLDLRGNGGGLLDEAITITGFFIGEGPVVQIKDAQGKIVLRDSGQEKPLYNGELAVLMNKQSASASEILAAALQDHRRAVIVGDATSYGKGTVQELIPISRYLPFFSDGSKAGLLKVTTQKFYRVKGDSTQIEGVKSDIVLPSYTSLLEHGESTRNLAMPHDYITPVRLCKQYSMIERMLPELKAKSLARIASDTEFAIIRDNASRLKGKIEDNRLSLNIENLLREKRENSLRRKQANEVIKARLDEIVREQADKYKVYRLALDDLKRPGLVPAEPFEDDEIFFRVTDQDAGEQKSPHYPYRLDPELRETIRIVFDMIEILREWSPNLDLEKITPAN